jgi:ankyrin repeat protein
MSLLSLANELLLLIVRYLDLETDISAFSRTNRRLHGLLITYLYRRNVQSGGTSALMRAASHGKLATARRSISAGADVQVMTKGGRTSLSLAAEAGHVDLVEFLLSINGVDPDSRDPRDTTPLYLAAGNRHEPVVKLLWRPMESTGFREPRREDGTVVCREGFYLSGEDNRENAS